MARHHHNCKNYLRVNILEFINISLNIFHGGLREEQKLPKILHHILKEWGDAEVFGEYEDGESRGWGRGDARILQHVFCRLLDQFLEKYQGNIGEIHRKKYWSKYRWKEPKMRNPLLVFYIMFSVAFWNIQSWTVFWEILKNIGLK